MAATRETQVVFRISKSDLFDDIKTNYPTEIDNKVFADVEDFLIEDRDTSFVIINFTRT